MGDIFSTGNLAHLLSTYGYVAVLLAVIVDSFGLPVPGEVMLLLAAVYAGATHHLSLFLVIAAAVAGAILGDNTTYVLGRTGGYRVLWRFGQVIHLDQERLKLGQALFRAYGGRVVSIGRLIPVLHIWTALLAGANLMPWRRFVIFNAAGAMVWASIVAGAGYLFGRAALHAGGVLAGLAVPMAVVIGLLALLLLRLNEGRLQRAANRRLERRQADV